MFLGLCCLLAVGCGDSVSSPEQAYYNGYTWGSTVKQKGLDAATKALRGTKNHPDYPAYQKNRSLMTAFQHGLDHGLAGRERKYLSIYGMP
jgi:hypothetical protein